MELTHYVYQRIMDTCERIYHDENDFETDTKQVTKSK